MSEARAAEEDRRRGERLRRWATVAGSALTVYGVCRWWQGLSGPRGPGFVWTVGHALLWCSQLALMAVVTADAETDARGQLPRWRQAMTIVVAADDLTGGVASLAQTTVDLAVGVVAKDRADMDGLYESVAADPLVSVVANHTAGLLLPLSTLLWALTTPQIQERGRRAGASVVAGGFIVSLARPDLLPLSGCLLCLVLAVVMLRPPDPAGPRVR